MNGQDVIAGAARLLIGLPAVDCQDYPPALTRAARALYQARAPLQGGGSREPSPGELEELGRALQDLSEILDTEGRIKAATEAIGKIPGGANMLKHTRSERDGRQLNDVLDRRGTPDPSPDDLRAAQAEMAGSAETAAERRDWADELEELLARLTAERWNNRRRPRTAPRRLGHIHRSKITAGCIRRSLTGTRSRGTHGAPP